MTATNNGRNLIFADTNVWIYSLIRSQDPAKTAIAQRLLRANVDQLCASTQIVNELCRNIRRRLPTLTETDVQWLIRTLYRRCTVVAFGQKTLLLASDLRTRYSFSFWDSLIVASALEAGAATLYTEDMQDGLVVDGQLRISNPFLTSAQ